MKQSPQRRSRDDILAHLIGMHHQDRSTLAGQCRFPVLEAHQPAQVLGPG
ncbi:hypothetical protein [Candidatus Methylacidithermus pantelleriae]|nr:hypothetical protein [Candidatus Methylacidithermus pantelleriae]